MSLHNFCLKKITAGETPIVPVNLGGQENLVDQAQKKLEPFEVPETRQLMEAKPTAIPGTWEEEDGGIIKTSKEAPDTNQPYPKRLRTTDCGTILASLSSEIGTSKLFARV